VEQLADLRQRPLGGELGAAGVSGAAEGGESAAALARSFASGARSPLEHAKALLARIEAWEPHLRALYAFEPDAMLAMARASEARWRRGEPLSALDGVPVTIKENVATKGTPVPLGSAAVELVPAAADAPPAARLREAGCVFVAKTTMPDFGMLSSGLSSFHPLTRNPWNLALNPGGSSAGAAAAAAAGLGTLHLGTDIGGSIRLPAGWCGVAGLKPSAGRVPIHPPYVGRVAGPIARSVADLAAMMAVLARPDARDTTSLPPAAIDWAALDDLDPVALRRAGRPPKLGLWLDAGWGLPVQAEVRAAVEAAALAFEAAGFAVEPVAPFVTRAMVDGLDAFWRMRSWLDIGALPPERRAKVLPYILEWARGAEGLGGEAVFRGFSQIALIREAANAATAGFDALISPVAPMAAFAAELASPLNDPALPFEHIAFTLPFNMSEQPAAAVPCAMTADGRPIGLQIAGPRHADLAVLRLARCWERLRAPLPPWPGVPG
jgi:Asp-tRNA(Asn)/Glu-tRNA(Gln) amidotransferase A subunit family amidase